MYYVPFCGSDIWELLGCGVLAQGLRGEFSQEISQGCSQLKAWMGMQYLLPRAFTHVAVCRRPWFLVTVAWVFLPCCGWFPLAQAIGEQSWSLSVFYEPASKVPPCHFCNILKILQVSFIQCGGSLLNGREGKEKDYWETHWAVAMLHLWWRVKFPPWRAACRQGPTDMMCSNGGNKYVDSMSCGIWLKRERGSHLLTSHFLWLPSLKSSSSWITCICLPISSAASRKSDLEICENIPEINTE